jgi:uncharacterized Zn-finger protein
MNKQKITKTLIVDTVVLITAITINQPNIAKSHSFNGYLNSEVKYTPVYATKNSLDLTHPQIFLEMNRGNKNLTIQKHPNILGINFKALPEILDEIGNVLRYLPEGFQACNANEYCKTWLPTLGIGGAILGVGYIIVALIDKNKAS